MTVLLNFFPPWSSGDWIAWFKRESGKEWRIQFVITRTESSLLRHHVQSPVSDFRGFCLCKNSSGDAHEPICEISPLMFLRRFRVQPFKGTWHINPQSIHDDNAPRKQTRTPRCLQPTVSPCVILGHTSADRGNKFLRSLSTFMNCKGPAPLTWPSGPKEVNQ